MELIVDRGWQKAVIPFPGGNLLLGAGSDNRIHLANRDDAPYRHRGADIHLNEQFIFTPPARVEIHLNRDGHPSGMCFHAAEPQDSVDGGSRQALLAELSRGLADTLRADPDLVAHVERACAEADLARARDRMDAAAKEFAAAGRAFVEAQATLATGDGDAALASRKGPAYFVVASVPGGDAVPGHVRDAFDAFASGLRAVPGEPEAPVTLVATEFAVRRVWG